eukprot:jgi/Ulvmu1/10801/UM069_0037.1
MQVAFTSTSKAGRSARGGRAVGRAVPEAAQPSRAVTAVTRRGAAAALLASVAVLSGQPAQAIFGMGEAAKKEYEDRTSKLLSDIRTTVALTGEEEKEAAVKTLKKEMNDWTAKYRNSGEGGRPSFSNMYSAINALAGHWTSFGSDAPVPKKRMARISKELDDVEKYLGRGR